MELGMEVPQILKLELPYDPVTPLVDIYPNECQSAYNTDTPARSCL
jgi:hypothetical protein